MERVGEGFEQGEFFVPELLLSARAMRAALEVLRPHLGAGGRSSAGTVVLGTVQGDVHKIGKSIVGVVLEGDGFRVHDLGEDVPPRLFVDKAQEVDADVVGLSALISLAVSKMAETVSLLKQSGFAGSVIVGGAAVTPATADTIGADAFAPDAWTRCAAFASSCAGRPGREARLARVDGARGHHRPGRHARPGSAHFPGVRGHRRAHLGHHDPRDAREPRKLAEVSIEVCEVLGADNRLTGHHTLLRSYEGLAFASANGKADAVRVEGLHDPVHPRGRALRERGRHRTARDPGPPQRGALAHDPRGHRHRGREQTGQCRPASRPA